MENKKNKILSFDVRTLNIKINGMYKNSPLYMNSIVFVSGLRSNIIDWEKMRIKCCLMKY